MSTRINSTRRNRMISNPESDNVVIDDLFSLVVEQTPITLDEQKRKINKLEAELKAEKEAYEKNIQTQYRDELINEINNKIKKLPRTDESIALLENISRMIPDEPLVNESVVNEPIELVVNEPVAIISKDRLENLPDRVVLVAHSTNLNTTHKVIYNKLNKKFYSYDQECYNTLNQAYKTLFNGMKGNAWERFKACENGTTNKLSILTCDDIKKVVDNSDKYCDKNFVFIRL
jgi:hypothetical protein